ncbi:MAG TPA: hypothetical protein VN711_02300 [Candidatus Saccharimonadales bacterium]|nr:hypothetical protein [Candidatus Saccharimonadales bacterium]
MNERKFLEELQKRAQETKQLEKNVYFPIFFRPISYYLGNHPWRILIPFAFLLTVVLQLLYHRQFDEIILWIFGSI